MMKLCRTNCASLLTAQQQHLMMVFTAACANFGNRGEMVRLETYFGEDGRLAIRRDWTISDATTGEQIGAATRCHIPFC
jgi:hypothetical protein